ncbi:MAG: Coenzyme F420 hydrogenase/dehydrogenase, beta subunit C-terminal domain [Candidatus Hodarchaeota archaeon]
MIIDKDNCVCCGACIAICPRLEIKKNKPVICKYDPTCSLCYKYCSKTYFPQNYFRDKLFGDAPYKDNSLGDFQDIIVACSTNKEILEKAQNGGIVSTILYYLLEHKIVDGVLLTKKDKEWFPKPFIAKDPEEILDLGGSIYSVAPTLSVYREAVEELKLKKLCYVGMPCHMPAVRKIQLNPPLSKDYGIITIIIGLFCSANYSYESLKSICENKLNISIEDVSRFDVSKGNLITITKNNQIKKIPIKETYKYHFSSCQYCKDYTAEFADLSIGSIGTLSDNLNSIIIRTKIAKSLIEELKKLKKIKIFNQLDINKIKKASNKKKFRIFPVNAGTEQILSLFLPMGEESQIFTAILSLGGADLLTLHKVLELPEDTVYKALNNLKNKLWIYSDEKKYKAFNPALIFQREITEMRDNVNKLKEIIKLNALPELENLYFQNNIKDIKNNDDIYTYLL